MDKTLMNPTISIIMPVYNASVSVGRMIDSIMGQTFKDWELIAVDDGSSDNSSIILDCYAAADSRIKVIHKQNGGVASARQVGIEHATGKYTIHADADDWMENNMLEEMLTVAQRDNADMVISDYYTDSEDGKSKVVVQCMSSLAPLDVLYALYNKGIFGALWHKLIKRSVYEESRASFSLGINYCEDILILTKILTLSSPKISYLPSALYHYVVNPLSLTQRVSPQGLESMKNFHCEASKYLPKEDRFEKIKKYFIRDEFVIYFTNRLYPNKEALQEAFFRVKSQIYYGTGLRWRLGYLCINQGYIRLAHRLIRFK